MGLQYLRRLVASGGCWASIILLVVLQVCFWPCFWGGKTLLASADEAPSILPGGAAVGNPSDSPFPKVADPGAAAWQNEPWFAFIRDQYRGGKAPLWNPYQAYGEPMAANMQSQPFYPLTFLLSLRLTPRTYNFFILARLFVAGICAYFYLRLFLSFTAAIAGGIASMLTGYYIIFITMPHLSVEVLIPAVLLAGEQLLRQRSYRAVVWLAIVVMLIFLGGMPESALLLLIFASAYLLFRIFSDPALRCEWKQCIGFASLGGAAGVGLSSFLLIPFHEFMVRSASPHDLSYMVGLVHDKLGLSALAYFFPLLFGPLYSSSVFDPAPLQNYVGLLSIYLIVIAVACALLRGCNIGRQLNALTLFFTAASILLVLKQFGFIGVNWIGSLPYLDLIVFKKYDQPILAFCVWVLCSIGIERWKRGHATPFIQGLAIGTASLVLALAFTLSRETIKKLSQRHIPASIPNLALILPGILLALLFLIVIADYWLRSRNKQWPLSSLVVLLIAAELSLNYIVPIYRVYDHLPSVRRNPYAGCAFVRFLQSKSKDTDRMFGRHWVLMPSWPSAFGLFDIRNMDGLYYKKYFPFLRNFLRLHDHSPNDLITCFFGEGAYQFRLPIEKRLLQLSSVKYLVTDTPFVVPNARIDEILRQNQGHWPPDMQNRIGRVEFILNGVAREGLGEHPPWTRLPYTLKVGDRQGRFHFSYALNPRVFSETAGDGVGFTLEVKTPSGQIEKLFSNYIDPKHNLEDRRWMDGEVDLSRFRNQEIVLLFSTDPGPRGNSSFDWAAWSDLRFEDEPPEASTGFNLIYNAETLIYEYNNVLPRAAIYYDSLIEKDEAAVLEKLADPTLDVFRTVVLDGSKLDKREAAAAEMVKGGIDQRVETANIKSYQSNAIEIEALLQRSGILVLNDSDYPGWRVLVDGHPEKWFTANYLFRGVLLRAGTHVVRFEYRPQTFAWGIGISLFTFGLLVATGYVRRRRLGKSATPDSQPIAGESSAVPFARAIRP